MTITGNGDIPIIMLFFAGVTIAANQTWVIWRLVHPCLLGSNIQWIMICHGGESETINKKNRYKTCSIRYSWTTVPTQRFHQITSQAIRSNHRCKRWIPNLNFDSMISHSFSWLDLSVEQYQNRCRLYSIIYYKYFRLSEKYQSKQTSL